MIGRSRQTGAEAGRQTASRESANLDLLRAIAVLSVFFGHLLHLSGAPKLVHDLPWYMGRAGVLMFFVHTTLVLMRSLERAHRRGESLFLGFYLRRFFRLYPLSIAFVLLMVWCRIPRIPWARYIPRSASQIAANLALVQNLFYAPPVLSPLWTLPCEMQMYLCLPLLYLVARRQRGSLVWLAAIWGAAILAALAQPSVTARLNVLQFAPCFVAGVLAYMLQNRRAPAWPAYLWPAALLLATVVLFGLDRSRKGWVFCLALGILIPRFRELSQPALRAVAHWVAKYSYGIYLSHFPVMWFAFKFVHTSPALQWVLFTVLAAAVPMAAYHALEHPMIQLGNKLASRIGRRAREGEPAVLQAAN